MSSRLFHPAMGIVGLGLLFACSHVDSEEGVSVVIALEPVGRATEIMDKRIALTEAWLASGSIELRPCGGKGTAAEATVGAIAHSTSSSTRLGSPVVENLLSTKGDIKMGRLSPPAGLYCWIRYVLQPADADATGLAEAPQMQGKTVLFSGTVQTEATKAPVPFSIAFDETVTIDLTAAVQVDAKNRQMTLRIRKNLVQWFEGLSAQDLAIPSIVNARLALNLQRSFEIVVQ